MIGVIEMGLENLWDKYGEKVSNSNTGQAESEDVLVHRSYERPRTQRPQTNSTQTQKPQTDMTQTQRMSANSQVQRIQQSINASNTQTHDGHRQYEANIRTVESSSIKNRPKANENIPGVFGSELDIPISINNNIRNKNNIFKRLKYISWVDVVCISITVIMILIVIFNFDVITTKIFYFLLPILKSLFLIFLVVGVIMIIVWWFRRNHRR